MTTWLVLLGTTNKETKKNLYQDMAKDHSIIMIGYSIEEDITKYSPEKIKAFFSSRGDKYSANMVIDFIHEIKVGDIVICPSKEFPFKKYHVGKVKSICHPVKKFFQCTFWRLNKLLKKHHEAAEETNQRIKPARKVKWEKRETDKRNFSAELQKELEPPKERTPNPAVRRLGADYIHDIEPNKIKENRLLIIVGITTIIGLITAIIEAF